MKLIHTENNTLVNAAFVKTYTFHNGIGRGNRRETWTLRGVDGEHLGETFDDPKDGNDETIIPADGWEILTAMDEAPGFYAEPVIAWRMLYKHYVVPITLSGMDWEDSTDYGLRQLGGSRIDMPGDSTYETIEAWLEEMKNRLRRRQAERSAS